MSQQTQLLVADKLVLKRGHQAIVRGLSMQVGQGLNVLIGPNGAGKTTLMETLAGVCAQDSGTLVLGELDPFNSTKERRAYFSSLGWLPQSCRIPPRMILRDLLTHACWLKGVAPHLWEASINEAMSKSQTSQLGGRVVGTLSGGERQRALLATCLVNDPSLLILDEPTAALDPGQRESFMAVLAAMGESVKIILSTHILDDVLSLDCRVIGMRGGQVVVDEPRQTFTLERREALMAIFRGAGE